MRKSVTLFCMLVFVILNLGTITYGIGYTATDDTSKEKEPWSGRFDTILIENEAYSREGDPNDIGYNIDAGREAALSINLYVGEPEDQTIPGRGRQGGLDPPRNDIHDYYKFTACVGQTIHTSLITDEDYAIELLDTTKTPVGQTYLADITGWYYLHVYANDDPDKAFYNFTIALTGQNDAALGDDAGDNLNDATLITPGEYKGYMDWIDQEDWYEFTATTGQGIFVNVDPLEKTDYDLHLYNPAGSLVCSAQYYGEDTLQYPADVTGTWTVKIDIFPGWDSSKWPDNYFLYGSGVYDLSLSVGGTAAAPGGPIPQPEIIPRAQTFVVNNDPTSNSDDYGYIAAIPAANYLAGGTRYVSPIIYQGVPDQTNWFGTVDDTTGYLMDDWTTYLSRHGLTPTEYIVPSNPIQAAAEIATEQWETSSLAVVAVDGSSFEDTIDTVINKDKTLNAKTEVTHIAPDSSKLKEIGGLFMVPMFIGPRWGALAVYGIGDSFRGDTGITTPRYETMVSDWWPYPYDSNGPDTDTYFPIATPGIWMPHTTSITGLTDLQIIKVKGDRYHIPVKTTGCSLNVTITTTEPTGLRVYLIDPYGNVRRPSVPHWNGGPVKDIHWWNGGHWPGVGYDEWRFWEQEQDTEFTAEINHPMKGRWTVVVVPSSVENANQTYDYHITGVIRKYAPERIAAGLAATNGAVIASKQHAPLLYVTEDAVPTETANALTHLGVQNIVFVNLDSISTATLSGTVTELTTMQQIVDYIGDNPENYITVTSFATGDGYFAPAAMIAAYHQSPMLDIGEAAESYDILDKLTTWEEYAGDYYHGCRSVGHLPMMDHAYTVREFIQALQTKEFPHPGFDLKLRWYKQINAGIAELTDKYGLDNEGQEAYLFVADRDNDIRSNICRAMNGNNSYAGIIPVETPAFASAQICRDILYPALIYANPGRNVTSMCITNHWESYPWKTNDNNTHISDVTESLKESFSSHGRFFEGHTLWSNLLARYNEGASLMYHCSHGTGGSGICCMLENAEEQFPLVELKHEYLKDFTWWDGWRAYYYDNIKTDTPRENGRVWFNAEEPNLYDFVHFKWVDQLFENLHSQFTMWQSCTTAAHFGPMIYLEHGSALWYGNANTGRSPQSDMFDYWMFQDLLQNGSNLGKAHTKYLWLHDRDFTTCDPTTLYGVSSMNLGDGQGDGLGLANEWVIFGDPAMICYSPEWTEPVPLAV